MINDRELLLFQMKAEAINEAHGIELTVEKYGTLGMVKITKGKRKLFVSNNSDSVAIYLMAIRSGMDLKGDLGNGKDSEIT